MPRTRLGDSYDLLVMDEVNIAVSEGFLEPREVVDLLREKPARLSVILDRARCR